MVQEAAPNLERDLAQAQRELSEAREQQAATAEVLRIVSRSPEDLRPVFETILAYATRLCQAKFGNLDLRVGDGFRIAALHNAPQAYIEWRERQPVVHVGRFPNVPLARIVRTKAVQHIPDLTADQAYIERTPPIVALVEDAGARSLLSVPMLKDGDVIGAIVIYRQEVRPFSDQQIELIELPYRSETGTVEVESLARFEGQEFAALVIPQPGSLTLGSLAAFIFYAVIVANALFVVAEVYGELQRAAGASERILELLATESRIASSCESAFSLRSFW